MGHAERWGGEGGAAVQPSGHLADAGRLKECFACVGGWRHVIDEVAQQNVGGHVRREDAKLAKRGAGESRGSRADRVAQLVVLPVAEVSLRKTSTKRDGTNRKWFAVLRSRTAAIAGLTLPESVAVTSARQRCSRGSLPFVHVHTRSMAESLNEPAASSQSTPFVPSWSRQPALSLSTHVSPLPACSRSTRPSNGVQPAFAAPYSSSKRASGSNPRLRRRLSRSDRLRDVPQTRKRSRKATHVANSAFGRVRPRN